MAKPGIFCVEGQWGALDERSSVLPTLELLQRLGRTRYIHKDVATTQELSFYLSRWLLRQNADYNVGYFAMHGSPGKLWLTDGRSSMDLADLAEQMSGKCHGRRLFFGSCSVLQTTDTALNEFLAETGADLVCGYTQRVDWLESAAFETVLLDLLANGQFINAAEKRMSSARWAPLASHLGFRIVYGKGHSWSARSQSKIPVQVSGGYAS